LRRKRWYRGSDRAKGGFAEDRIAQDSINLTKRKRSSRQRYLTKIEYI
jgi:hypothetical protein